MTNKYLFKIIIILADFTNPDKRTKKEKKKKKKKRKKEKKTLIVWSRLMLLKAIILSK